MKGLKQKINKLEEPTRELWDDNELWGKRARLVEVWTRILAKKDVPIANELNNVETILFLLRKKWEGKWPSAGSYNGAWDTGIKFVTIKITKKILYYKNM